MAEDSLIADLQRVLDALHAAKLDDAICGGIAVNIHGHVPSTTDLDFLISPSDRDRVSVENLE